MPGFGVVVHHGRHSGRRYQTPVNVFPAKDGYLLALTYGQDTDWVKNALAAGGCELRTPGWRRFGAGLFIRVPRSRGCLRRRV